MKNLLILFAMTTWMAHPAPQTFQQISKAISSGNATVLGQYLNDPVELSISNEEDLMDKKAAVEKIRTFFGQAQPKSFSQIHQGTSKGDNSHYCIGNLLTTNATYRVYIYTQNVAGKSLIHELRFDRD